MVFLYVLARSSAWGAPPGEVSIQGACRQGGVIFVTLHGASPDDKLSWLGVEYPLAVEGDTQRAILPVPVETAPGGHELRLGTNLLRTVQVARVNFPHRTVTLPAAMLATYDSKRNKDDDALIFAAARIFTPQRYWRGPFLQPAAGPLSTGFGAKRTYNGWRKGWHKGLDVEADTGTPIEAPNGAVVALVAPGQLVNGNATLLDHGMGVYSLYMHQSRILVKKGQRLTQSQLIGKVGSTGAGTGPHLHWQCFVHGVPVDPKVLMHAPAGW